MSKDPLTDSVIGLAIEVHRTLGPGLLESVYEACLSQELPGAGIAFRRQVTMPVSYKGAQLESGFRADLVVQNELLIEMKSIEKLTPLHEAQALTYLRLGGLKNGLLIDFDTRMLEDGIRRFVM